MLNIYENHKGKIRKVDFDKIKSLDVDWIDCNAPTEQELLLLQKKTGLPLDRLKTYLDPDARPHVLEIKNFSLVAFAAPTIHNGKMKKTMITIFLFGTNNILTLHDQKIDALDRIRERVSNGTGNNKNNGNTNGGSSILVNGTHFLFTLLDEIINDYFRMLETLQEEVDILEEEIMSNPKFTHTKDIRNFKKNVLYVHKGLTANREVVVSIEKGYLTRIDKKELAKYRFIYNDLVQLLEMNETYRDILTGAMEIYLTSISNSLNHSVKRLTSWGGLILIPTLIASIYGMNFHDTGSPYNMPELGWKYGYFFALGIMILSVVICYRYFKKKDWM